MGTIIRSELVELSNCSYSEIKGGWIYMVRVVIQR
jgi:hypothetical protein